MAISGVSKVVTVDVKGNWQRWLKVRDLTKGVTYFFRVQAQTIAYGPELQANVTAGPAEGEWTVPHSSNLLCGWGFRNILKQTFGVQQPENALEVPNRIISQAQQCTPGIPRPSSLKSLWPTWAI